MKAMLERHVIAESDDIVENGGYHYFPSASVHMEWLEKASKTASFSAGEPMVTRKRVAIRPPIL